MGLFDKFKKKNNEEYIDDVTFIRDIKHIQSGPWHQYDVLLAAQGYGWDYMISSADYMAAADLENISQVTSGFIDSEDTDITEELKNEAASLSVAGISKTLKAPMKIVWFNQTQVLRFFTIVDDETLIKKYIETVIRRTFGTNDAMKLAKPIPKQ